MSWIPTDGTLFPEKALPYGVFLLNGERRLGVAIGAKILDLESASEAGLFDEGHAALLQSGRLNELLAAGRPAWTAVRDRLRHLVADSTNEQRVTPHLVDQKGVELALAWDVADYVDFYSSRQHAENLGRMFRPDAPPLLENWLWLPVAYHGRAGTVAVSGTPIVRPAGQVRNPAGGALFAPTARLDIELELGFVLGGATRWGETVSTDAAAGHIFGVVLLNDWSARDIQAWEYVPLGPNLGKSFASSVSAWVLPIDALEDARVMHPDQTDPVPLPYLASDQPWGLDVDLEVWLQPAGEPEPVRVSEVNASAGLYWTAEQQLAHMTVNGATVRPGDFFGSGTISGSSPGEFGSLIEMTSNGATPLTVGDATRTFLEDGDRVILRGSAGKASERVYLGEVEGTVVGVSEPGARQ